ncbi:chloride channel protein [soil metagenome]
MSEQSSPQYGGSLPIAPSLGVVEMGVKLPPASSQGLSPRFFLILSWALILGIAGGLIARLLRWMIAFFTNLAFFGRFSLLPANPAENHLGVAVICIPVIGGLIVGIMARYGSKSIRGHGIPEAMEQVLINQSRLPMRLAWLKPLSAAIAIGTGGPFGAEGPIIATGGALGSALGQFLRTSADERKTLLACGAAAGMAAIFGAPVAAVLLAIELLLFEFRAASIIPVAIASVTAASMHLLMEGPEPVFHIAQVIPARIDSMILYVVAGGLIGLCAVLITRAVYAIEDAFARLPIHWMWWPAIGAIAVGVVGYFDPRTLGVGYLHISALLSEHMVWNSALLLCIMKFVSWSVSLGSGTSGGTLAPLFIIGGALGYVIGVAADAIAPGAGVDVHVMAIIGMAAMFSGAARAMLTSAVFAYETTMEPLVLLPLLGACAASWVVATLLMRESLMTEKVARRGIRVPTSFHADPLEQLFVRDVATGDTVTVEEDAPISGVRALIESGDPRWRHQGFPVLSQAGVLKGVITRRDIIAVNHPPETLAGALIVRPPVAVYEDCSLREAIEHMLNHDIGRLPILARKSPAPLVGILTRSDILSAYRRRMDATMPTESPIMETLRRSRNSGRAAT